MSSTPSAGSFRTLLAIPHAAPTFGAALTGRLAYGLLPLAMLFTVQQATKSFTSAGAALATFGLTAILLPAKARILDRQGHKRVLPALSITTAAALTTMAALAWSGTRTPAPYLLLATTAGVATPPLGPAMRAIWRTLTKDTERAYSLDAVCEETLYLIGPLIVGLILTTGSAQVALISTAALLLVGTLIMAATAPTQPKEIAESQAWNTGPLKQRGFRRIALTIAVTATGTAIATTAVAARSQQQGAPSAAGYIEAALAVGSVIGGLAWGRRQHARTRSTHLTALTILLAAGVAIAATAGNLILLGVVMALTGVAVAPLFIVAYVAADELAPKNQRTEASTWINTANNLGAAAGATLAGALIDHANATTAFAAAAITLTLAAAAVRNGRHWIDTTQLSPARKNSPTIDNPLPGDNAPEAGS